MEPSRRFWTQPSQSAKIVHMSRYSRKNFHINVTGESKRRKEGLEVWVGGGEVSPLGKWLIFMRGFRGLMPLICTLGTWWSGGLSPEDLEPFDFKGCREERSYYPAGASHETWDFKSAMWLFREVTVEIISDCARWEYSPEFNFAAAQPQPDASFKIQASFKMEAPRCFR